MPEEAALVKVPADNPTGKIYEFSDEKIGAAIDKALSNLPTTGYGSNGALLIYAERTAEGHMVAKEVMMAKLGTLWSVVKVDAVQEASFDLTTKEWEVRAGVRFAWTLLASVISFYA